MSVSGYSQTFRAEAFTAVVIDSYGKETKRTWRNQQAQPACVKSNPLPSETHEADARRIARMDERLHAQAHIHSGLIIVISRVRAAAPRNVIIVRQKSA